VTAASDALAVRLRPLLPKGLAEKAMFGGIGFMLDGNMLVATTANGDLLVRIDPEKMEAALARPGTSRMQMGSRTMSGFVAVDPDALPDAAALKDWIATARAYVRSLPPK